MYIYINIKIYLCKRSTIISIFRRLTSGQTLIDYNDCDVTDT